MAEAPDAARTAKIKPFRLDGWQRNLALVTFPALVVFAIYVRMPSIYGDGDTYWHIAAGRWILEHRLVPTTDPFSYTFQGQPWTSHEWLAEIVFAVAHDLAGWRGVSLLTAAAAAAIMAVVAAVLAPRLGTLSVIAAVSISFPLLNTVLLARPHMLALVALAIWTGGLLKARREDRRPSYWLILVVIAWANMHGSFIVGLGLAGAFALEAVLEAKERRWQAVTAWGGFVLAAASASLLTPHGFEGWQFPFRVMRMETLTDIEEWRSSDFTKLSSLEIAVLFTLFICLYRGVRIAPIRLLLLVLLLHMALSQVRQVGLLAVVGPMLLVDGLAQALEPARGAPLSRPPWRAIAAPLAVTLAMFVGVAGLRLAQPQTREDGVFVPSAALAHVPADLAKQPVFNDYGVGGWLIFRGIRPFIDGRADMYGDDFMRRYKAIANGDPAAFNKAAREYGFRWTIVRPNSGLVKLLDARPDWRRLYVDKFAVVHVYTPAQPSKPTLSRTR